MDPIAKLTDGFRSFRDGRFQEQRSAFEALVDHGAEVAERHVRTDRAALPIEFVARTAEGLVEEAVV